MYMYVVVSWCMIFVFFFKQKTAYEMRISDWSSDVCSSDLIPSMPKIPDDQKPAIGKVIAPEALFWFRWGAMSTLITGLILAAMNGYIVDAIALGRSEEHTSELQSLMRISYAVF